MRIKNFGMGLLVAAGSFVLAAPAFAGVSFSRLNGGFALEDQSETTANQACVVASGPTFEVFGQVTGTSGSCLVDIDYFSFFPNKASASVLKTDDAGNAKVSQQGQTEVCVTISGEGCTDLLTETCAFPDKCKASGSVNATEGFASADTVDKGKANLSCDVGSNAAEFGTLTEGQLSTILAAFADRKDVKITDQGKLTIKTKGVAGDPLFCD